LLVMTGEAAFGQDGGHARVEEALVAVRCGKYGEATEKAQSNHFCFMPTPN
jgi:hypothetical protein